MRQQIRGGPLTIAAALQEFERQANQANRARVGAATIPKTNTGLMTRSGTRGFASPAARVDRAGNDAFPPSSPQVMAAERERRVREGQAKKAALTAELARVEANRGQLGTSISWSHYLNVKDQLRKLKRDITLNKGLTPADVIARRPDPEPEEEDQSQPLAEWFKAAGPAALHFLQTLGTALDDSTGVHTDKERKSAVDSLPSSFRSGVTQPILSAPKALTRQASTSISRGLGNGSVNPDIYQNDPASKISDRAADYAPYAIPGLGPILGATQKADLAAQFLQDPGQASRDLYAGMAPWDAETPEDAVFRSINLILGGIGVSREANRAHIPKKIWDTARAARDKIRSGQKIDSATAHQLVSAARDLDSDRHAAPQTSTPLKQGPVPYYRTKTKPDGPIPIIGENPNKPAPRLHQLGEAPSRGAKILTIIPPQTNKPVPIFDHRGNLLGVDKVTPRPHGEFDPFDIEEQLAARTAAQRPIEVGGRRGGGDYKAVRSIAFDWLKKWQTSKQELPVPAIRDSVKISADGISKLHKGDYLSQLIVPYIPELLGNAEIVYHEEMKRTQHAGGNMQGAVRLVARASTPVGPVDVWMLIRRAKDGNFYYHHQHTQVVLHK